MTSRDTGGLRLLPPNSAQGWTGIALLVIGGGDFHLIAFLLQSAYVCLIRPGLHACRRRIRLEGVRHEFKALVQQCADLRVLCSDQCEISLFLGFCHMGLLEETAITRRSPMPVVCMRLLHDTVLW